MALSFHPTTALLFHLDADPDMSFLQDIHPEVTDALLGFIYEPLNLAVNADLDDFLNPLPEDRDAAAQHCAKRPRASYSDDAWFDFTVADSSLDQPWNGGGQMRVPALPELLTEFVLPLPPPLMQQPLAFVRGADAKNAAGNGCQSVQSAAAREHRRRISKKSAELSRLIPGGHRLNTAEMLEEAGRHVKFLQAQNDKMPSMAQEQMHVLLVCGSVQEQLATEGKCLVPRRLVDTMAKDNAIKSNALVNRDLNRFMQSLEQ